MDKFMILNEYKMYAIKGMLETDCLMKAIKHEGNLRGLRCGSPGQEKKSLKS